MKPFTALRACLAAFVIPVTAALLVSCATPPGTLPPPKLLVFMVVDVLPQRQITAYRDQLSPDGFARFLDRGTWFANANYSHSFTVTAAGHAVLRAPDQSNV